MMVARKFVGEPIDLTNPNFKKNEMTAHYEQYSKGQVQGTYHPIRNRNMRYALLLFDIFIWYINYFFETQTELNDRIVRHKCRISIVP